jgi:hypothetical protein
MCVRCAWSAAPKMAVAVASPGATTAAILPCSCVPSTTRIAGSPASISTSTSWSTSSGSPMNAWINWNFNDFGWLKDNRTLWYLSEQTGYSQLYSKPLDGKAKALTSGKFEVSHPLLSDRRQVVLRAHQPGRAVQLRRLSLPVEGRCADPRHAISGHGRFQTVARWQPACRAAFRRHTCSRSWRCRALAGEPRELTNTMKPVSPRMRGSRRRSSKFRHRTVPA